MNGGNGGRLSIRQERESRVRDQNKTLNFLRLAYFLHPSHINEYIDLGNPMVRRLLKALGLQTGGLSEGEIYEWVSARRAFYDLIAGVYTSEDSVGLVPKEEIIKEYDRRWSNHFLHPEAIPMWLKGSNPKAVRLKTFEKKVIAHQTFQLRKLHIKHQVDKVVHKKPFSYADFVQQSALAGRMGISQRESDRVIKSARRREKEWDMASDKKQELSDKILAKSLYGAVTKRTLVRVRQDRKRLRRYNFL